VHVFEEDRAGSAVFRPEQGDVPLSRRPRERFELRPDGTASVLTGGPDDRFVERTGHWAEEGGRIVIRVGSDVLLTICEWSPDRVVVQFGPRGRE
jgi:hypothetical protein